jgi:serine/threonine protein kinase
MNTLGKYEILAELGTGSMGIIYRARDTILDREVALKTFAQAGSLDPELKERFYREARFCARLHHPNIVTIYDLGEQDGTAFISMELLAGYDMRKFIGERHELPIAERIRIMAAVCDGLQHAHESGIVHRDIKPSNILLTRENVPKILDFGIARFPSSRLTMMGRVLGTPHYMAPEQIMGKPCDARSDLFAAALVTFEMLTYAHPFAGESIPRRIINDDPDSLLKLNPAAPPGLEPVMKKALSKDPAQRYQTAADLAAALRSVLDVAPVADYGTATAVNAAPVAAPPPPAPPPALPKYVNTEYKMSEVLAALQAFDAAVERKDVVAARSALATVDSIATIDDVYATAADLEASSPLPPPVAAPAPPPTPYVEKPVETPPAPTGQAPVSRFLRELEDERRQAMQKSAPPPPATPTVAPPVEPPRPPAQAETGTETGTGTPAAPPEPAPMMSGDVTRFFNNARDVTRPMQAPPATPPPPEQPKSASSPPAPRPPVAAPPVVPPVQPPQATRAAAPARPAPAVGQKQKNNVLIAVVIAAAVVIIGGAVAVYALTHRGNAARVPAVATAEIAVTEARLYSAPSEASDILVTLKRGDRLNVTRVPSSRDQEWTQVQYAGTKIYPAGAMRTADLGNWSSDHPDTALYLLQTFAPAAGAGPAELQEHARRLSDFLQRFPNAPQRAEAQAELDATNANLAKLQGQTPAPAAAPGATPAQNPPAAAAANPPATPVNPPAEAKVSPEAAVKRATSYWEQGEYAKAERLLKRVLQADPNYAPAKQLLGRVQKAQQLEGGH